MLALLSPAKSLDFTAERPSLPCTTPALLSDAVQLMATAKRLSPADLARLMTLSPALAALNHERFQAMSTEPSPDGARPAGLVFAGDTYVGLDAASLSDDDLRYAQDHVAILSGLYGLLRPLDAIQPYRLEMGTRLRTRRGADLYGFWGPRIARRIDEIASAHDDPTVVCLASTEYAGAVDRAALRSPWVGVRFEEVDAGRAQVVSFYAKKARGMMARWMVRERVDRAADLTDFADAGYRLVPERSTAAELVFARPRPQAAA